MPVLGIADEDGNSDEGDDVICRVLDRLQAKAGLKCASAFKRCAPEKGARPRMCVLLVSRRCDGSSAPKTRRVEDDRFYVLEEVL